MMKEWSFAETKSPMLIFKKIYSFALIPNICLMHMSLLIKIMPGIVICNKHVIEKHIMDLKISLAISGPSEHNFTSP